MLLIPPAPQTNNVAASGGALFTSGAVRLDLLPGTTLAQNRAGDVGGALCVTSRGATAALRGATLRGNTAGEAGGGAAVLGASLRVEGGSEFEANTARGAAAAESSSGASSPSSSSVTAVAVGGGAVAAFGASLSVTSASFSVNTAARGGGGAFFLAETAQGLLLLSSIDGTAIAAAGDGTPATAVVTSSAFRGNAAALVGGAVATSGNVTLTVVGTSFDLNRAGIAAPGLLTVEEEEATRNGRRRHLSERRTLNSGAAPRLERAYGEETSVLGSPQFASSAPVSRPAALPACISGSGGSGASPATAAGAPGSAGALWLGSGAAATLNRCALRTNEAARDGGAVVVSPSARLRVENSLLIGNTAVGGSGGAFLVLSSAASAFASGAAPAQGGQAAQLTVVSSSAVNQSAALGGFAAFATTLFPQPPVVSFSGLSITGTRAFAGGVFALVLSQGATSAASALGPASASSAAAAFLSQQQLCGDGGGGCTFSDNSARSYGDYAATPPARYDVAVGGDLRPGGQAVVTLCARECPHKKAQRLGLPSPLLQRQDPFHGFPARCSVVFFPQQPDSCATRLSAPVSAAMADMLGQQIPEIEGVVVRVDCASAPPQQQQPDAPGAPPSSPFTPPFLPAEAPTPCTLAGARDALFHSGAAVLRPVVFGEPQVGYGLSVQVSSVSGVLQETAVGVNLTLGSCGCAAGRRRRRRCSCRPLSCPACCCPHCRRFELILSNSLCFPGTLRRTTGPSACACASPPPSARPAAGPARAPRASGRCPPPPATTAGWWR